MRARAGRPGGVGGVGGDSRPTQRPAGGGRLNDLEQRVNPSAPFIGRPVATTLITIAIAIAGLFAFLRLPVAPMPQVDYPTILVSASMPGASPNTATVATPLERYLGIIADVAEMTSESTVGITRISLQFNLKRSLDGAARKRMVTALGRSCARAGGGGVFCREHCGQALVRHPDEGVHLAKLPGKLAPGIARIGAAEDLTVDATGQQKIGVGSVRG
jgi:hypothetical protein